MNYESRSLNHGRVPRRRLEKVAFIALPVICVAILAGMYGLYRSNLHAVDPNSGTTVSFEIPVGEGTTQIAKSLKSQGLIRDRGAFSLYLFVHNLRGSLQAGTYTLSAKNSTQQIVAILSRGKIASNLLVIPEGSTAKQVAALAAKQGIPAADFKAALGENYDAKYANQRPRDVDLEGYLFPDGYAVGKTTTAHQLVQRMLTEFDQQMSPDLVNAFAAEGLSVHQGVTLASVIEKEVSNSADRPIVAQVFLKRLREGQPLQSDVTVHYAADQLGVAFSLSLNSPYNTYKVSGLPVGPICNPGLDALSAAAHPAATNYSYFLAGKDGKTHFATTFAQHQANIQKYLQ